MKSVRPQPPVVKGAGAAAAEPSGPPDHTLHLFNMFLFLAGLGGTFFRMARDNDDLVRMAMVLVAGAALPLVLAVDGTRLPMSLALPALGWAASSFLSSFVTVNASESLKEFLKIGVYLLLFITLASAAVRQVRLQQMRSLWLLPAGVAAAHLLYAVVLAARYAASHHAFPEWTGSPEQVAYGLMIGVVVCTTFTLWMVRDLEALWVLPASLAFWGTVIGFIHADPGLDTYKDYPLWSPQQVEASLLTTVLWCAALTLWLSRGTVRDSVLRGCTAMAITACAIGVLQFYRLDPLRPWDPPQPYNIYLRGWMADAAEPFSKGMWQQEAGGLVFILPRVLGIYGNPDFFAPYIVQFLPLAIAVAVLNPAARIRATLLTLALLLTLGLTYVWGAFLALFVVLIFFIPLLGWVHGVFPEALARQMARWAAAFGAALLVLGILVLYRTTTKKPAIEERIVKVRMAAEMWRNAPLIGAGVNSYKSWYPVIQQQVRLQHHWPFENLGSSFTQENRTHNDLAQMLAETGTLGLGLFLWFMVTILAGALRILKRGARLPVQDRANICGLMGGVAVVLVYALPNFPFHIVSSAATFWVMAGLLASYHAGFVWSAAAEPGAGPLPVRAAAGALPLGDPRASTSALEAAYGGATPLFSDGRPSPRIRGWLIASAVGTMFVTAVCMVKLFDGTLEYKMGDQLSRISRPPDPVQAAIHYRTALDLDPFNAQYAYDYGAMCFNVMGTDTVTGAQAAPMLNRAHALGFVNEDLEYGLGHIAERAGQIQEAYLHYSRATALNERHEPSRQGRLRILLADLAPAEKELARHRWGKARELYGKAFKAHPGNWLAAYKYGTLSVTPFGDTTGGIDALREAAQLAVNEASVYLALGRALASVGRFADAREALERAVMFDPKNPENRSALDQCVSAMGAGAHPAPPPPAPPRSPHNVGAAPAAPRPAGAGVAPRPAGGGADELNVK